MALLLLPPAGVVRDVSRLALPHCSLLRLETLRTATEATLAGLGFHQRPQRQRVGWMQLLRRAAAGVYQQLWRFHRLNFRRY